MHGHPARPPALGAAVGERGGAVESVGQLIAAAGRSPCRGCGSHELDPVIDFGDMPLANSLLSETELREAEERFPLRLLFCPHCALVQLGESVAPKKLFAHYLYASSFSDTMLA